MHVWGATQVAPHTLSASARGRPRERKLEFDLELREHL